jgi:hypothetical protein
MRQLFLERAQQPQAVSFREEVVDANRGSRGSGRPTFTMR